MGNIIKVGGYAMLTRRQFVFAAASLPGGLFALQACSSDTASQVSYAEASQRTWRHTEGAMSERSSLLHELVRYGTLAASSHNSQCWKFHVEAHATRFCPICRGAYPRSIRTTITCTPPSGAQLRI